VQLPVSGGRLITPSHAPLWRPRLRSGAASAMITKDLVRPQLPDPSRSSKN